MQRDEAQTLRLLGKATTTPHLPVPTIPPPPPCPPCLSPSFTKSIMSLSVHRLRAGPGQRYDVGCQRLWRHP